MNSIIRLLNRAHSGTSPDVGTPPSRALPKRLPALRCLLAGGALILGAGVSPALCEEVALLPPPSARAPAVAFERTVVAPAGVSGARDFKALWRDPAIRNYVGLSENSWDFNAPGGVPGFGPLDPKQQD